MLVIPKILEYSEEQSGNIVYGVGLCFALFFTECMKTLSLCSCWVFNQRTGIRFRTAIFSFAFEKLMQFKSLTHITVGEVSVWNCHTSPFVLQTSCSGVQGREKGELGEEEERERK